MFNINVDNASPSISSAIITSFPDCCINPSNNGNISCMFSIFLSVINIYGFSIIASIFSATIEQLGRAKQIKVQKENTIIVNGAGDKEQIAERIKQIKVQMEETKSSFDKEKYQERLAKIAGGVAVIEVGAATEVEMKDKKLRVEEKCTTCYLCWIYYSYFFHVYIFFICSIKPKSFFV